MDELDKRPEGLGFSNKFPITGFKIAIIVADSTSSKEEDVSKNMLLTDLYFWGPQLATAGKTAELILMDKDDNVVYASGECDFSSATAATRKQPIHLQRGIMDVTTFKVETDENVTGAKTFYVTVRGM